VNVVRDAAGLASRLREKEKKETPVRWSSLDALTAVRRGRGVSDVLPSGQSGRRGRSTASTVRIGTPKKEKKRPADGLTPASRAPGNFLINRCLRHVQVKIGGGAECLPGVKVDVEAVKEEGKVRVVVSSCSRKKISCLLSGRRRRKEKNGADSRYITKRKQGVPRVPRAEAVRSRFVHGRLDHPRREKPVARTRLRAKDRPLLVYAPRRTGPLNVGVKGEVDDVAAADPLHLLVAEECTP